MAPGKYTLKIQKEGYKNVIRYIEIKENEITKIDLKLELDDSSTKQKNEKIKKGIYEADFGEYIDSQHMLGNTDGDLTKMYSVLMDIYEPRNIWKLKFKDKKLDLNLEEKQKFIGDIPIIKLAGLHSFFLRGQSQLGRNTVSYLVKVARKARMQAYLGLVGHITYGLWMPVMKNWIKWVHLEL